jgi:hypothetical protein
MRRVLKNLDPRRPLGILLGTGVLTIVALLLVPPIAQNSAYHLFADQTTCLGVPNFWNVMSNLPFVLIGIAGLCRRHASLSTTMLFVGILLTGLGSAYYHWQPNDDTLFWDRLPMTITFMAILAGAIEERVSPRLGVILLWPLLAVGLLSLVLWRITGDLRPYVWVQFFPCLVLPLLFWLTPARYTRTQDWIIAAGLYGVAKVFEFTDVLVYSAGGLMSGHTLKHLIAAAGCFMILRHFQTRQPIAVDSAVALPPTSVMAPSR